MKFKFMESLRTGIKTLDDDHRDLIGRVNLIAELEQPADTAALIDALSEFKADLVRHFQSEEAHLRAVNYPRLDSHARHHAETILALDRLMRDVENSEPIEGGAAYVCYHELVVVVLQRDMQFINWAADRQKLKA